jgi:hypothetical protein
MERRSDVREIKYFRYVVKFYQQLDAIARSHRYTLPVTALHLTSLTPQTVTASQWPTQLLLDTDLQPKAPLPYIDRVLPVFIEWCDTCRVGEG